VYRSLCVDTPGSDYQVFQMLMCSFIRTSIAAAFACCSLLVKAAPFETTITVAIPTEAQEIPQGIYGQYLEHVQADEQTIYPSLWDSESPHADEMGVRLDVTSATRALNVPVVRWPGGCFADVYHWEDAIGPRAARRPKPNRHWGGIESNMFGTDEFLHWCRLAGVEPYINVNLGSGTLDEALRWLEYCNGDTSTPQGALRAANGHPAPYGVKYWGIGNETWGPWETGHTDAATYGTSLSLWAKAMRAKDSSIRIQGVGSEEGNDRAWDTTVLKKAATDIDLLTVHMYGISTTYDGSEYEAFVFTPDYLENRLRRMLETVDSIATTRPINLSIDEWNIRHHFNGKQNRKSPRNLQDALFTAEFFNAMIRLSPRIEMANYVFLANGNGALLINDDQIVWTPLAHVFQQYRRWMTGAMLDTVVDGPATIPPLPITGTPGRKPPSDYKPAATPWINAAAAHRADGSITVAIVNRHPDDPGQVALDVPSGYGIIQTWTLNHSDIYAKNTFAGPDKVKPTTTTENGKRRDWTVAPHSISLVLAGKN